MKRKTIVLLTVVSAAATVWLGLFVSDENFRRQAFRLTGYYFILVSFFLWLACVLKGIAAGGERPSAFFRNNWAGIALSLALAAVFFLSVHPHFRVLADETNLIGLSKSMLLNRTADNSTIGYWYYNSYHPIVNQMDKRPNLFPFLLSVVHTLKGYSAYNGFILNFIATVFFFLNIYLLVKAIFSPRLALLTTLMTGSYPVVALTAASSGFEMLNALFTVLALRYLRDYLNAQGSDKLSKLLLTLVLLAQCRYESAGTALIIMTLVFLMERPSGFKNISPITALVPFLYIPYLWQRTFSWQAHLESKKGALFGMQYFREHLAEFLRFFFLPANQQPVAFVISYLGIAGLCYAAYLFFRRRKAVSARDMVFAAACVLAAAFNFFILLSEVWGDINEVYAYRLSIIFIPLFSFCAAFLLHSWAERLKAPWCVAPFAMAIFIFFHPLAIRDFGGNSYIIYRGYILDIKFLERFRGKDNLLVISDRPGLYTVHNWGACSFEYANHNKEKVLNEFRRHLFSEIVVIQEVDYDTGEPLKDMALDKAYRLRTVYEIQNDGRSFRRYSVCRSG